jgi:hypothetical protein
MIKREKLFEQFPPVSKKECPGNKARHYDKGLFMEQPTTEDIVVEEAHIMLGI